MGDPARQLDLFAACGTCVAGVIYYANNMSVWCRCPRGVDLKEQAHAAWEREWAARLVEMEAARRG